MSGWHVRGVIETALYVDDLERAQGFYERVFGFTELMREPHRLHALSVSDQQVLLLFRVGGSVQPTSTPGGTIPPHDGHGPQHLAFEITPDQIDAWRGRLRQRAV